MKKILEKGEKERKVMKPLIIPIQLKLKKHNIQTNK